MSIADYANRKYDFLAFQNVNADKERRLGLLLYDEDTSGKICVGIQKLAQRWALEFLTERGSMPGLPSRGAPFMLSLRRGELLSQFDVIQAFALSALQIRTTLQTEEYDGMPDDERLDAATLISVGFLPGYLNMRVMITSLAGDERAIILPITTLP